MCCVKPFEFVRHSAFGVQAENIPVSRRSQQCQVNGGFTASSLRSRMSQTGRSATDSAADVPTVASRPLAGTGDRQLPRY
jgi:hypothetical protein